MSANPILASLIPAAPPAPRNAAPLSSHGGDGAAFEGLLNGFSDAEAPGAVETPANHAATATAPAAPQDALPSTLYALALRSAAAQVAPDPSAGSVPAATTMTPPPAAAPKTAPAAAIAHPSPAPAAPRPTPTLLPATKDATPPLPGTNAKAAATAPTPPVKASSKTSPPDAAPSEPVAANPAPASPDLASQGWPPLAAATIGASVASTHPTSPTVPTTRAAAPALPLTASPTRAAVAKTSTPPSGAPAAAVAFPAENVAAANAASPLDSGSDALASAVLSIAQALSPLDAEAGGAPAAATAGLSVGGSPLTLRGVQARTHLTVVGSRLFSVASARSQQALESAPTSPTAPAPTVPVAPAATLPKPSSGSTSGDAPARDDPAVAAPATPFVANAPAVLAAAQPPADSVSVADLGDRLADEASTLTPTAHDPTAAAPRGPVKELKFQLEPADLGKVAVKLRLSTGRLTVDIGVDNPGALSELEKQREAMAAKLSSSAQPLESLVIHQQSAPESPDGAHTASSAGFSDSPASREDAARRQADGPPDRPARASAPTSAPSAPLAQRADLLV